MMMNHSTMPPIFIIGVPRSGTTLLRTLLDSHPNIACGPESPWLARSPVSIKRLYEFMRQDKFGLCKSYKVSEDKLTLLFKELIDDILLSYAYSKGKYRWAEKTPDHSLEIPFLSELFPDAYFVHLVRDGRDVACSTAIVGEERKKISSWHSQHILVSDDIILPNTVENAAKRWAKWLDLIENVLKKCKHYVLRYEDLVALPETEVKGLFHFVGEAFDTSVLRYQTKTHDFPDWEWGSQEVSKLRSISKKQVGRWKKDISSSVIETIEAEIGEKLIKYGYRLSTDVDVGNEITYNISFQGRDKRKDSLCQESTFIEQDTGSFCRLASVEEMHSPRFKGFMALINNKGQEWNLRQFTNWSKIWEYPWLWFNGLECIDWANARLLDLGSELSPMAWFLASLGARVTLVEADDQWVSAWEDVRKNTGLSVDWQITHDEHLPFPDKSFDVVTSFSVIEHQQDKRRAIDEITRVLKHEGMFAMSFDICEPDMGMTFPEWNGKALTMKEFEDLVWENPAFDKGGEKPLWNVNDCIDFIKWHLQSAPYHNYVVGAAILRKTI